MYEWIDKSLAHGKKCIKNKNYTEGVLTIVFISLGTFQAILSLKVPKLMKMLVKTVS